MKNSDKTAWLFSYFLNREKQNSPIDSAIFATLDLEDLETAKDSLQNSLNDEDIKYDTVIYRTFNILSDIFEEEE